MAEFIVKLGPKDIIEALELWCLQRGLKYKNAKIINSSNSQSIHPGMALTNPEIELQIEEIPKLEGAGPYR